MPEAKVGQRVSVNLQGLNTPGVQIGSGVTATGTITAIDVQNKLITVKLDVSFSGNDTVVVTPDRVAVLS